MDKLQTAAEAISSIQSGMTIGIGGWGPRRKPMALVRELLRSDVKDLTVVAYGGADVGMLCAAGKVKKVIFAFVSLDFMPLEPGFRLARELEATQCEKERLENRTVELEAQTRELDALHPGLEQVRAALVQRKREIVEVLAQETEATEMCLVIDEKDGRTLQLTNRDKVRPG